jgi:hypothetical protein
MYITILSESAPALSAGVCRAGCAAGAGGGSLLRECGLRGQAVAAATANRGGSARPGRVVALLGRGRPGVAGRRDWVAVERDASGFA